MKLSYKKVKTFFRKQLKWKSKLAIAFYILILISTYAYISYLSLPDCKDLRTKTPQQSMLMAMRIRSAEKNGKNYKIEHVWTSINRISPYVINAVVIGEDTSFFWHSGVDFAEMKLMIKESILSLQFPRGVSTITQQLAKNLYLADSWLIPRKFKEIILASRLEKNLSKYRILELYLNFVEWGNGIFGIEAAARHYFKKSASELNENESVFLAAIVPGPMGAFNPETQAARVKARGEKIKERMKYFKFPLINYN
jgi:monofunctional biosynthetic peptidoglycan transglycosylase